CMTRLRAGQAPKEFLINHTKMAPLPQVQTFVCAPPHRQKWRNLCLFKELHAVWSGGPVVHALLKEAQRHRRLDCAAHFFKSRRVAHDPWERVEASADKSTRSRDAHPRARARGWQGHRPGSRVGSDEDLLGTGALRPGAGADTA